MIFIVSLLLIIIMHELGHFVVARYCKCKVEVVSLGFGRPLIKKKIKGVIYQICPIILGGYCKLKGENAQTRSKYAFCNLRYIKKVLIVIAGVFTNFIIGVIALVLGKIFNNVILIYFAGLSILMAAINSLPIPPLDGSYPFIVLLEKVLGKKRAYAKIEAINKIGFIIIMILNILCIPIVIWLFMKGR